MKRLATIGPVLLLFLATSVQAQEETPDTTSAWRYFPLDVGNVWEYEAYSEEGGAYQERWSIVDETLLDGVYHVRLEWQRIDLDGTPDGPLQVEHVRFDTLATAPVQSEGITPYGVPWGFPLGAPFGSSPEYHFCETTVSGGYERSVEIGDDTAVTSVKYVSLTSCEGEHLFAAGIGLVEYYTLGGYLKLRYARVGGVEYGERFAVATEGDAETGRPATLTFYPNPARSQTAVTLTLGTGTDVAVEVYDGLGRRVALLHEGSLPAGEHTFRLGGDLPSGVYLVRAATDGGRLSQRVTLVR